MNVFVENFYNYISVFLSILNCHLLPTSPGCFACVKQLNANGPVLIQKQMK